jgi:dipeptidyl aminopeptidase/acylaminoacyl peptidase
LIHVTIIDIHFEDTAFVDGCKFREAFIVTKQMKLFGTWPSPISPDTLAESVGYSDVQWDGDTLIWLESRGGKQRLLAQKGDDAPLDLIETNTSIKGRVGYGGGAFTIAGGVVYYAGDKGGLHRLALSAGRPKAITPPFGACAAPRVSPDGAWVAYVHTDGVRDSLAIVDSWGKSWPTQLVTDADFVMQPAWSPDSKQLAYITWNHPQMPWDGTTLTLATLSFEGGTPHITHQEILAGDEQTAIFQPEFSPDGRYLSYISDQSGFGQIYVYDLAQKTHTQITDAPAEHGTPAWVQGLRMMSWSESRIFYLRNSQGFFTLHQYDTQDGKTVDIPTPYTSLEQISASFDGHIALIASSDVLPPRIITVDASGQQRIYSRSSTERLKQGDLSQAQAIQWQVDNGQEAYGLYYPPTHAHFTSDGLPPLMVIVHGGPTAQKTARYEAEAQFFATRGYAVLYVNHRGSTGYGRDYMLQLRGNWGAHDVEDAALGAAYLAREGLVDRQKFVIMGGSAGGYTVLQSMVSKPGFYAAGICRYGISNQFMLVQDTHKFEERYNDSLLGTLPDAMDLYRERSPLFHAEHIIDPLLIFQGSVDTVVPQSQSDMIVTALKARGIPHEYHIYEGEGHGFGKPQNIRHYYETMHKFLLNHVIYV